jgi:O-antigen/teichoic acid export membrane protein
LSAPAATADSVKSRYVVTLAAQIFRMLLSVVTASIVPRTLGPASYGNYSFLLSTAAALRGVLDNSTQQAFFTFSAQERASGPLTRLYARVLAVQALVVFGIIGVAAAAGRTDWLWRGLPLDQILWVTLLDWLTFLALSLQQLGDSKGLTVRLQVIGSAVAALTLIGLLGLWISGTLNFYTFAWMNLTGAALTCTLLGYWLFVGNRPIFWSGHAAVRGYIVRWWGFARPLLLLQYYFPLATYLGVFLIQKWYGSQEQGYYALAVQWAAFAMIFTNAAVWIFWREIAHYSAQGDVAQTSRTYEQFCGLFYLLVLILACWLAASSGLLVRIVAGERFVDARLVVAIMAFYPVAQTIGQLTMACLRATERTSSYARWSVLLSIPDLSLSYFLLAPPDAAVPGLHLGAVGMAVKTVAYGLLSAHVYDWVNCRHLKISFAGTLGRRLVALIAVGVVAGGSLGWLGWWLARQGAAGIVTLLASSCVYGLAIAAMIWIWPGLAGMTREQMLLHFNSVLRRADLGRKR